MSLSKQLTAAICNSRKPGLALTSHGPHIKSRLRAEVHLILYIFNYFITLGQMTLVTGGKGNKFYSGGRFKNAHGLLNLRALKIVAQCCIKKSYLWMYGHDIFVVPFEIPHKISYSYIDRCGFYLQVKIKELVDSRAHKCFWKPPPRDT